MVQGNVASTCFPLATIRPVSIGESTRLLHQGGVPILPHRIVTQSANSQCHFVGTAGIRNIELLGCFSLRIASAPCGSSHDSAVLSEMQFVAAGTGVTARLRVAAGAHQGNSEWNKAIAEA